MEGSTPLKPARQGCKRFSICSLSVFAQEPQDLQSIIFAQEALDMSLKCLAEGEMEKLRSVLVHQQMESMLATNARARDGLTNQEKCLYSELQSSPVLE